MIKLIKKVWNWAWDIYHKNEEIWNYLISGGLGVVISVGSFWLCRVIGLDIIPSNVISWIIAVLSMYVTNKFFVFKTKCNTKKELFIEFISFIGARVSTLVIETAIIYVGAEVMHINEIIVKVIAQVVVIVLNYVFSKLWIFKNKKENKKNSKEKKTK